MNSSTVGNHDGAMPPLKCRAERENEFTPATFFVEVQESIVQIQVVKNVVMSQDLTPNQHFFTSFQLNAKTGVAYIS